MSAVAPKSEPTRPARATYQDVLAVPAHRVAEIIDRTLYTHPRPAPAHALASSHLGDELVGPFGKGRGGPGGWWIIDEPELHLGKEILVPDLVGWRRERMENLPDTAYFTIAPDWACVVLSESTEGSTCKASGPSTRAKASGTCGSLTRRTGTWRRSNSTLARGFSLRSRRKAIR